MIRFKSKKAKAMSYMGIIALSVGIIFFLLRGPYLSNSIKRIIIPVLENATRERIIIDSAVINLFPFYLQAKGLKVFDKDGNRLLWITKTRVYIDLLGLLSREISVRKLALTEPELTASETDMRRIIDTLKESFFDDGKKEYRVSLKNVQLTDGKITFVAADDKTGMSGSGLFLDMVSKNEAFSFDVLMKSGTLNLSDGTKLKSGFDAKFTVKGKDILIKGMNVHSDKSGLNAKGRISLSSDGGIDNGSIETKAKIYVSTIGKFFGLKRKDNGSLSIRGSVKLAPEKNKKWPGVDLDLDTEGRFDLETLMSILKIEENIRGDLSLRATVKGAYPDLHGEGTARLENAVIDGLPLDDVAGDITYQKEIINFNNLTAHSYGGTLEGKAGITLPEGSYFVNTRLSGVSSPEFFRFIRWEPPFPKGRIGGSINMSYESGKNILLTGDLDYINITKPGEDVLSRLKSIHSSIDLKDEILTLRDTLLSTSKSSLLLNGIIDLNQERLDLALRLDSSDASDLVSPYYKRLNAPVRFDGKATGMTNDPLITGRVEADPGSVHGIRFTGASADLAYMIKALSVKNLHIDQGEAKYEASGTIDFREAKGFFSFESPFYKAKAEVKDAEIKQFIAAFYKELPVSGSAGGTFSFEGSADQYVGTGDLVISGLEAYGQHIEKAVVKSTLHPAYIELQSVDALQGESKLAGRGKLYFNKRFEVSAVSDKFQLCDFPFAARYPFDAVLQFDVKGSGMIDNPDLTFSADIQEGLYRGAKIGSGEIRGGIKNKKMQASGKFLNGLVTAGAEAVFADKVTWNADIRMKKGRYDFLLARFIRDIPEDIETSLAGNIKIKGEDKNYFLSSRFTSAALSLYGYDFRNSGDIVLEIDNGELRIKSLSISGNNAGMSASGIFKRNGYYDLTMEGNLDIAPLKGLTDKLSSLRGRCGFRADIKGSWERPEIFGEINVNDLSATLTDMPYKIGPVNGTVFFKKDRFTFDSVSTKFAGGDLILSGAGYLEGRSLKRFYMNADINSVRIRPAEGLNASLDGRLFYERTYKGSSLTGDIDIRKARYDKRFEWKSWLLGLKEMNQKSVNYPSFLADTGLNIHVEGSENILIDNNIAKTPVKIALNVTGTFAQSGLLGRIEADEGTVYFRSNEFKVLDGSTVDFVEPNSIAPVFHIIAETYINDYYVKLSLDGTRDSFTLSLYSDPPLSETDILSLLTVGQVGKDSRGIESGLAAGEATALVTGGLQDIVEEELKNITGFERFEIEPHTTTQGAFVPRVIIGKRLFEDKLYVIYSTSIGSSEEDVIKLQYKLGGGVSVEASRNEIGSVGGDLKYKFEFK